MEQLDTGLGCGEIITTRYSKGNKCGVADAWGSEHLCENCKDNLKRLWSMEDQLKNNYITQETREIIEIKLKELKRKVYKNE